LIIDGGVVRSGETYSTVHTGQEYFHPPSRSILNL
jgi:hypothetical protein